MTQTKNSGIAGHLHHNTLLEWCWDYRERIKAIDTEKPEHERATRKRLLWILTEEQVAMLPKDFVEVCRIVGEAYRKWKEADWKWEEAYQKWKEACQKWEEACQKYEKAYQKWKEACQKYEEAYQKYKPQLEEIHKKICNCKEWNGTEIVFGSSQKEEVKQ